IGHKADLPVPYIVKGMNMNKPIITTAFTLLKMSFLCFCAAFAFMYFPVSLDHSAQANDSAVEVTPLGLQFKFQKEVSIEKEDLTISTDKIEVTCIFKNQSPSDIVTEVAFPIPEYKWALLGRSVTDFADFTVQVDGERKPHKREVKAFAREKDCTRILTDMNISIVNFGKYKSGFDPVMKRRYPTFVDRLEPTDKNTLIDLGILRAFIEADVLFPDWSVYIKYHWTQRFPARKMVIIKHSYSPYTGYRTFCASESEDIEFLRKNACINESFISWMKKNGAMGSDCPWGLWVSYILTTANNWHGPIKDFRLTIEKKADEEVSTCFDPKIRKTGDNRYESWVKNFVPEKDLKVFFFSPRGEVSR
ncbi:MAG: DUF4424 family protein, partial [Kosmotogaceae bacterium]|nr:DUF4424 family protein [Kosmotogaceae bacterium]